MDRVNFWLSTIRNWNFNWTRRRSRSLNWGRMPSRRCVVEQLEGRNMLSITVNTLVDEADGSIIDGDISLRDAIALAPAGETINFEQSLFSGGMATLNLTVGPSNSQKFLSIDKNLTIEGPGANLLTIKAFDPDLDGTNDGDGSEAFEIYDGSSGSLSTVALSGMTITGGDAVNAGGIWNTENLHLLSVALINNAAPLSGSAGGGIYSDLGNLIIDDCTIANNASRDGGGIFVKGSVAVTITNSDITTNTATFDGAGIYAAGSTTLTIDNSNVSNNVSQQGGNGAGLRYASSSQAARLVIKDSIISGNQTSQKGGGMAITTPRKGATIVGTTIANNSASIGGGFWMDGGNRETLISSSTISGNSATKGGGLYAYSSGSGGNLRVENSTFSYNNAAGSGGGMYLLPSSVQYMDVRSATITRNISSMGGGIFGNDHVNLRNTIIAGNTAANGTTPNNIQGTLDPKGSFNLVGTNGDGGLSTLLGNMLGIDNPQLGSLANNGGSTATHAPLVGSPVIDNGDPNRRFSTLKFDQRGNPTFRVRNGRIDIGAVESSASIIDPPPTNGVDLNGVVTNLDFENYNSLPTNISQMAVPGQTVIAWAQLTDSTSDYYNSLGYMGSTVPNPDSGFAPSPENGGDGFVGVLDLDPPAWANVDHEYVVNVLPTPLAAETTYKLDVFAGTTSGEGGGFGGAYVGELVIYGLIDASLLPNYMAGFETRPIEEFAAGNVVELLSIDVDQAASMWTAFPYQTFTTPVAIEAIVLGARTERPNSYLLIDASGSISPPNLLGDYNLNGAVDSADYVIWRKTLGTMVEPYTGADGNGNGIIDQTDYDVWRAHFGQAMGAGTSGIASVSLDDFHLASISKPTGDVELGPTLEASGIALPSRTLTETRLRPIRRIANGFSNHVSPRIADELLARFDLREAIHHDRSRFGDDSNEFIDRFSLELDEYDTDYVAPLDVAIATIDNLNVRLQ